jgi:hypothetical protein
VLFSSSDPLPVPYKDLRKSSRLTDNILDSIVPSNRYYFKPLRILAACKMSLSVLPVEIISRICGSLGVEVMRMPRNEPLIFYKNKEFQALRMTCRVCGLRSCVLLSSKASALGIVHTHPKATVSNDSLIDFRICMPRHHTTRL